MAGAASNGSSVVEKVLASKEKTELPEYVVYSSDELMELDVPPPSFFVPKLIPERGLIALSGPPASLKTMFGMHIARQLALGESIFPDFSLFTLDKPIGPVPTLFIEEENDVSLIKYRYQALGHRGALPLFWSVEQGIRIDEDRGFKFIKQFVEVKKIRFIVFDPFSSMHSEENENSATEMARLMNHLRQEFTKNGVTIMFIHHPSKGLNGGEGHALRGSGDILAKVDSHIVIRKKDGNLILTQPKLRSGAALENEIRLKFNVDGDSFKFECLGEFDSRAEKAKTVSETIHTVLAEASEPMNAEQVVVYAKKASPGISDGEVKRQLKVLSESLDIMRSKSGKTLMYQRMPETRGII